MHRSTAVNFSPSKSDFKIRFEHLKFHTYFGGQGIINLDRDLLHLLYRIL